MLVNREMAAREFKGAFIRAQDSRHLHSWTDFQLDGAYIVACLPGISLPAWLAAMGWELEPEDPKPEDSEPKDGAEIDFANLTDEQKAELNEKANIDLGITDAREKGLPVVPQPVPVVGSPAPKPTISLPPRLVAGDKPPMQAIGG